MSGSSLPTTFTRRTAVAAALAATASPATSGGSEPALKDLAARTGRLFGAAIEPEAVDHDPDFAALISRQCSLLIPENAMKWNALRPSLESFDFRRADRLMEIADHMNIKVHGHCLVWHEALPAWFPARSDAKAAEGLLRNHIQSVAGRYRGRIGSWDVVNEAVERADGRADGLRRSPWLEAMGPTYLEHAFEAALAADPQARLALSDYGLEYDSVPWMVEKRATMLKTLGRLVRGGTPIHALAIQGHLDASRSPAFGDGLRRFLDDVAELGLSIVITELDVNEASLTGSRTVRDKLVADTYFKFADAILRHAAVSEVSCWGLSDRYTSRASMFPHADGRDVRPLPFDTSLHPKASARALQMAFNQAQTRFSRTF